MFNKSGPSITTPHCDFLSTPPPEREGPPFYEEVIMIIWRKRIESKMDARGVLHYVDNEYNLIFRNKCQLPKIMIIRNTISGRETTLNGKVVFAK